MIYAHFAPLPRITGNLQTRSFTADHTQAVTQVSVNAVAPVLSEAICILLYFLKPQDGPLNIP